MPAMGDSLIIAFDLKVAGKLVHVALDSSLAYDITGGFELTADL